MFHTTLYKALFIFKRTISNIQTTVTFLCNIFKGPEEDDCNNLLRMIKYLQETRYEELTLEINNMTMVEWYADATFAVHVLKNREDSDAFYLFGLSDKF